MGEEDERGQAEREIERDRCEGQAYSGINYVGYGRPFSANYF